MTLLGIGYWVLGIGYWVLGKVFDFTNTFPKRNPEL